MSLADIFKKTGKFMSNGVKMCDLFPQDIKLTYKGKSSFTTLFGGIVSMTIMALCITYGASLFLIMINRGDSNKSVSSEFRNLNEFDQNIFPYQEGLKIAIAFTNGFAQPITIDPSYFTLQFYQGTYINDGTSVSYQRIDLGYEL